MTGQERQQTVLDLLKNLHGLEPLKQLIWSELNYERVNQPLSRRDWAVTAHSALADDPVLLAGHEAFHVVYARLASDRLLLGQERLVVSRLIRDHPYALFIFANSPQERWHFINVKYDTGGDKRRVFRRITVGPEERLRTASERLALLDFSTLSHDILGLCHLWPFNSATTRHSMLRPSPSSSSRNTRLSLAFSKMILPDRPVTGAGRTTTPSRSSTG